MMLRIAGRLAVAVCALFAVAGSTADAAGSEVDKAFYTVLGGGAALALHLVVAESSDLKLRPNKRRGQYVGVETWVPTWSVDLPYWQSPASREGRNLLSTSAPVLVTTVYAEARSGKFSGTAAVVYGNQLRELEQEVERDSTTGARLLRMWGAAALPLADHVSVRSQLTAGTTRGTVIAEAVAWDAAGEGVAERTRVPMEAPLFQGEVALLRHFHRPTRSFDVLVLAVGYRHLRTESVVVESGWKAGQSAPSFEQAKAAEIAVHNAFAGLETRPVTDWRRRPRGSLIVLPEGSVDLGFGSGIALSDGKKQSILSHTMRSRIGLALGNRQAAIGIGYRLDFWDVDTPGDIGPQWREDETTGQISLQEVRTGTTIRSDNFLRGPYLRARVRF